jgi:RecJ-like exonuclease
MQEIFIHDQRLKVINARIIELKNKELKTLKTISEYTDQMNAIESDTYKYLSVKNNITHKIQELEQIRSMLRFNMGLLTHDDRHLLQLEN